MDNDIDSEDSVNYPIHKRIKDILVSYYRGLCRLIHFKNAYFFDTNMVISNSVADSRLLKLFTLNKRFYLTEKNNEEIENLLATNKYRRLNSSKFDLMSFDKLRSINPTICPVYFNFILQMNNSAVPFSPDFFSSRINAILARKGKLMKKEKKILEKVSMMLKEFNERVDRSISDMSSRSPLLFRSLPRLSENEFHRKKRKAIIGQDPNYFNDLRSLSLALLYCLAFEENTTFVTSDSDLVHLFFVLNEAISYQWALKTEVILLLNDQMKKDIISGKDIEFQLNILKITNKRIEFSRSLYNDFKKKSFLFRIKFWSIEEQRYYNIDSTFDEPLKNLFINSHGPYNCPVAKNSDLGNWINCQYWWPPEKIVDEKKMKVVVSRKPTISKKSISVSNLEHNSHCLYFKEDKSNNYRFFLNFFDLDEF